MRKHQPSSALRVPRPHTQVLVGNGTLVYYISENWPASAANTAFESVKWFVGYVLTGFGSGQVRSRGVGETGTGLMREGIVGYPEQYA